MEIGDRVERKEGFRMPGVVRAMFRNRSRELRIVVECDADEETMNGTLIIYSPDELRVTLRRAKSHA